MFCFTGRRQHDQVRFRDHDQVVGGDVDGVQPHRRLEDVLIVDPDHERCRPQLARLERNRPADQAEADNPDLAEDGSLALRAAGLDDGKFLHFRFQISDFRSISRLLLHCEI
jgi:hypothetical protein